MREASAHRPRLHLVFRAECYWLEAGERVRRCLTADPGLGVVRHADAGYEEALATARDTGIRMPMLDPEPDR